MREAMISMLSNVLIPFFVLLIFIRKKIRMRTWIASAIIGILYGLSWDIIFSQSVWIYQKEISEGFIGPLPMEEYISIMFMPSLLIFIYLIIPIPKRNTRRYQ